MRKPERMQKNWMDWTEVIMIWLAILSLLSFMYVIASPFDESSLGGPSLINRAY